MANKYSNQLPITILFSNYKSAAAARNTGASIATSDYLLFLDADMRITADFTKFMLDVAKAKKADFVSPRFKAESNHIIDNTVVCSINTWIATYHMRIRNQVMGIGGAILIRKTRHDAIGGYTGTMREFDDIDYCTRLNVTKIPHAFADKAVAVISSRRFVKQGRMKTLVQSLPDNYLLVKKFVRPIIKTRGIKPKWDE